MPRDKCVILLLRGEQRLADRNVLPLRNGEKARPDLTKRFRLFLGGIQRRADGHEAGRSLGEDRVLPVQSQRAAEGKAQPLEKVERSAQKEYVALDAPPLRKPGDRLIDDRLKDGSGDIRLARALIEKGLDIRLCKHAAARGDGIDALRL